MANDVAALVDNVSTFTVWASARFAEDDVAEFRPGLSWPACLGCEDREPTDVAVLEHDARLVFFEVAWDAVVGWVGFGGLGGFRYSDAEGECGYGYSDCGYAFQ